MTSKTRWLLVPCFLLASLAGTASASNNVIDTLLGDAHTHVGLTATNICDDATFLRRLSLDLIGRVPTTSELEQFVANPDRTAAVDRLLASQEHDRFWSQLWTSTLIGRGQQRNIEREVLRRWVEGQLSQNVPLSQMAYSLITAQGVSSLEGPVNYVVASRTDPVMRLSRTFLSVQLDCAQCHDHPHDRWTNEDYLAMQRFFQTTQFREVSGGVAVADRAVPENAEKPVFLTGRRPHTSAWRQELGLMVVQSKPFSRAMVNRTWHWLMGRGIIDPVDGLSRDNPASVPQLLETLASDLRADGYQLRPLVRRICLSQAYQRQPATASSSDSEEQLRLFAARNVRPMLPEQWLASTAIVLDRSLPAPAALANQSRQLLGLARQGSPANDPFQWTATTQTLIRQLAGEVPAPLRDLDTVFLATLARRPTEAERELVAGHRSQDTLFALVHGNEFIMND